MTATIVQHKDTYSPFYTPHTPYYEWKETVSTEDGIKAICILNNGDNLATSTHVFRIEDIIVMNAIVTQ
jgi:hypothetical protein